jgi:hypothetical protein
LLYFFEVLRALLVRRRSRRRVVTEVVKTVRFERGWPTPEVSGN